MPGGAGESRTLKEREGGQGKETDKEEDREFLLRNRGRKSQKGAGREGTRRGLGRTDKDVGNENGRQRESPSDRHRRTDPETKREKRQRGKLG